MKVKTILIYLGIFIALVLFYGVYKLLTFQLFDSEIEKLEVIDIPEKDYSISIYYVPSDATIQSSIQVRKMQNGVVEVLENYERFNFLNSFKLLNKDTLKLIVSDTSRVKFKETKKIKLP